MSRVATFGLTILLAVAHAALAVDGTVLINQSTITNGLTGCPTGGHFPIVICQSGSYKLSSNLTVPDANTGAIQISVDNVTLDMNGFSILGPTVCAIGPNAAVTSCSPTGFGTGISSVVNSETDSGPENIVLMNGHIKGMGLFGILLNGSKSEVRNIHVSNNGSGGIQVGVLSLVSSCTVTTNAANGISASQGSVVTGNIVSRNQNFGILSEFSPQVISGNSSFSNGGTGIFADCAVLISNNFASIATSGSGCVLVNNAP